VSVRASPHLSSSVHPDADLRLTAQRAKAGKTVKHEDNNTNSSTTTTVKPDHPKHTLEEALALPEAISRNGGQPLPPIDTATAMNRSPGSSIFRMVTGASHQYGLTNGSYKSDYFTLEDLGRGVIEPNDPNERPRNLVAAALRPPLFQALFDYYRGKRFPEKQFFVKHREARVQRARAAGREMRGHLHGQHALRGTDSSNPRG
jgi:hypothetical protein